MRKLLKFKQQRGNFRIQSPNDGWENYEGLHYVSYPFMIHKSVKEWCKKYSITHIASGTQVCKTKNLKVAKYIATRLAPLPQFLLPHRKLVSHMSEEERMFCTRVMGRYRDVKVGDLEEMDKNCPYSI
jgi:hypothetical protein